MLPSRIGVSRITLMNIATGGMYQNAVKIKDIAQWPQRCATPRGTLEVNVPVAEGVLVDLSLWGGSIINLVVECPDGNSFGSLRAAGQVFDYVLQFLRQNQGRRLCEIIDSEVDISTMVH
jgi:hypothetical protein